MYKVRRISDNQEYALKRVKFSAIGDKEKASALNEIRLLASVRHPNIVCYKDSFWDSNSDCLWLFYQRYHGVL